MTLHLTPTQLAELDPEDFARLVEDNVLADRPNEERQKLWGMLTTPTMINLTVDALSKTLRKLDDQLEAQKVDLNAYQQECSDKGAPGMVAWHSRKRQHEVLRQETLAVKAAVQARHQELKAVRQSWLDNNPDGVLGRHRDRPTNPGRRTRNLHVLFRLAAAVARHREAAEEEEILPEPHDLELWDALDSLRVITAADLEVTLSDWVEQIMSKPGFTVEEK